MLVYRNELSSEPYAGQRNIEQLPQPTSPCMSVNFNDCFFEENFFSFSAIASIFANVNLQNVIFRDNGRSRMGAIGAMHTSNVTVSSSCFIKNSALLSGIIHLDSTSNFTANDENYGEENESMLGGGCASIFSDDKSCAVDGNCVGTCSLFLGQKCIPVMEGLGNSQDIGETPPPAPRPTSEPTLPPTAEPTNATANGGPSNGFASGAPQASEGDNAGGGSGGIIAIILGILVILGLGYFYWKKKYGMQSIATSYLKKKTGFDFNSMFGRENERESKKESNTRAMSFSLLRKSKKPREQKKKKKRRHKDDESSSEEESSDEESSFQDE